MAARVPTDETHPREARLRRRIDFRRVQSRGARVHTPHFILVLEPTTAEHARLGITVTRRVGTAVRRNRVKRLVREVFRRHREAFPARCDIVAIAKVGAAGLAYRDVESELVRARDAMKKAAERAQRASGARR
jgi:ribonuclease P protein component